MKTKIPPQERKQREAERWARAKEEAERLERVEQHHSRGGLSWDEAQAQEGLRMPYTSLRERLRRLREFGIGGLLDHRHPPPSRLTSEIRGFILGLAAGQAEKSTADIREAVRKRFGLVIAIRTVGAVLQQGNLARPVQRFGSSIVPRSAADTDAIEPTQAERAVGEREELGGAGPAWLRVASDLTGYGSTMAKVVSDAAEEVPIPAEPLPVDRSNRNTKGQFLPEYNAPRPRTDPDAGAVFAV